ncbi:hypothetical protein D3C80_1213310 [compost metagenome]
MIILRTNTYMDTVICRSHHFHQCRCLFKKIQNTLHLIDIPKFRLCQHIRRSAKKQPLRILTATIQYFVQHLNQFFEMINVTLHFLSYLAIQCRLQLVNRHSCQLAIEQINYLLHFCN